jgi:hypothetical protein
MLRTLERVCFPQAPAARLGLFRLLLGLYTLVYVGRRYRMLLRIAASDPALFQPVGVARGMEQPLPLPAFRALLHATLLANLAFLLGWRHRASGPLFGGLLLWLLCYRNSWSMIYHNDNSLVLHALILGLTPAADALSLDALRAHGPQGQAGLRDTLRALLRGEESWQYGWPLQLVNAVTLATYFLSAVAKVRGPLGWGWASGEVLRSQIAVDGLRKELFGDHAAPMAYRLYRQVGLFRVLAAGSLVVELLAPLALLSRRGGQLWAGNAFAMHWGIFALMKITFRYQMAGLPFVPFFAAERVLGPLVGEAGVGRPRSP